MAVEIRDEIEQFIRVAFEDNFRRLQAETGGGLAPDIKAMALDQVLLYWRKLRDVATRVTDTEVRLNLPGVETPAGREFGIEGVVDIVREEDHTVMYDIKTHEPDYVRTHREEYCQQLNIYAYIWSHLRGEPLDETAIIATAFPDALREALESGDETAIERATQAWDPVIEIPYDSASVEEAIQAFAEIVDAIEEGKFGPPAVAVLRSRTDPRAPAFGTRICRNCDARFSCRPYRLFAQEGGASRREPSFKSLFKDQRPDWEREAQVAARQGAAEEAQEFVLLE
jgi:hypothetical protein